MHVHVSCYVIPHHMMMHHMYMCYVYMMMCYMYVHVCDDVCVHRYYYAQVGPIELGRVEIRGRVERGSMV